MRTGSWKGPPTLGALFPRGGPVQVPVLKRGAPVGLSPVSRFRI